MHHSQRLQVKNAANAKVSLTKLSLLALSTLLASGCVSAAPAQQTQVQTQQVMPQGSYSEAEIAQLLAPIALYPDSLLSHILIAATYPLEVIQAERWLRDNPHLNGTAAVEAATDQPWDPSVIALTATPDVLKRMSDDIAWTQRLGEAVLTDEEQVIASIQVLREQAYAQGQLASNEHVVIEREQTHKTIVIETVKREYIYVPYYDSRVVYGGWRWYEYPPIYWPRPTLTVGFGTGWYNGIYWGVSYHVPSAFYFSYMAWPQRYIVVNHHYYQQPQRRHPQRYHVIDQGQRWQHNPQHRRGVAYKHRDLQRDQPKYQRISEQWQQPAQPRVERQGKTPIDRRELDRRELETRIRQSPVAGQPERVKQPEMRTTPIERGVSDREQEHKRAQQAGKQPLVRQPQQREVTPPPAQQRQEQIVRKPEQQLVPPVRTMPVEAPQRYREKPMTTTPVPREIQTQQQYTRAVQQPQVRQPVQQPQLQQPQYTPPARQEVHKPAPPAREHQTGKGDRRQID